MYWTDAGRIAVHNKLCLTFNEIVMFNRNAITTLATFALLIVFSVSLTSAQEREYRDYLLKKVGNLYILNVGGNDSVKEYKIYDLYFEHVKRLPVIRIRLKTIREYFGAVQATQLFPDYCVVRIISRVMEEEPKGNRIVLVPKALPKELLQQVQEPGIQRRPPEPPAEEPEQIPIVKSIETHIKDASYKPFSISINYFREFDQIAKPVTNNLITNLNKIIYSGEGVYTSSFSTNGGINAAISKMILPNFAIQAGVAYIKQKSNLNTRRSPESETPIGLVSVKNWDFSIETQVVNWSLSLQASQFSRAVSYFIGQSPERRITPRIGIGIDYAMVDVKMDHSVVIGKLFGDEARTLSEKHSMGGYWGVHAVVGADYYVQAVKFFAELNYNTWFTEKFKPDFPLRFGMSFFF